MTQMRDGRWDLYMNGVYAEVLKQIAEVHARTPDLLLYMQPHRKRYISRLRDNPPTEHTPIQMWISTTDDLEHVSYSAEIVGWDDKTKMSEGEKAHVRSIVDTHQSIEAGMIDDPERWGVNLLHVRRMTKLTTPFPVSRFIKVTDGKPLKTRTQSGGHSYVWLLGAQ